MKPATALVLLATVLLATVLLATVLVSRCMPTNVLATKPIRSRGFLQQNFDISQNLDEKYESGTFDQYVDHTRKQDTFKQWYWFNKNNYISNGPIILYNTGENDGKSSADSFLTSSYMLDLTKELKGIFVVMEHRYYGSSMPGEDYNGINKLLTIEQSLADIAHFIQNVKFPGIVLAPNTPWIMYGGSYSGVLAAWMREKYPHLVFASVATSAPVQLQMNFWQYYEPIRIHGPQHCIQAIQSVVKHVDTVLGDKNETVHKLLKKQFKRENSTNEDFGQDLAGPLRNWQHATLDSNPFDLFCSSFTGLETLEQYVEAYAHYIKNPGPSPPSDANLTSWTYQACTEFGYFTGSPPEGRPTIVSRFATTKYWESDCADKYSEKHIPPQPNTTLGNSNFGGWLVELDHIIWVNGERDPWRWLSVSSPDNHPERKSTDQALFLVILGAVHCWDHFTGDKRTDAIKKAQDQIYSTLSRWLKIHYTTNGINFAL